MLPETSLYVIHVKCLMSFLVSNCIQYNRHQILNVVWGRWPITWPISQVIQGTWLRGQMTSVQNDHCMAHSTQWPILHTPSSHSLGSLTERHNRLPLVAKTTCLIEIVVMVGWPDLIPCWVAAPIVLIDVYTYNITHKHTQMHTQTDRLADRLIDCVDQMSKSMAFYMQIHETSVWK